MAVRSAMHQAGAAALTELLQYEAPARDQRKLPCPCGQHAQYVDLRSKTVLTAVGNVELRRPYYLCAQCGKGQFPVDAELDIEHTESSPGVRRMLAVVGADAPFDHGREQMKTLAGLAVTTKAVERTAEAIGADIARRRPSEPISPGGRSKKSSERCSWICPSLWESRFPFCMWKWTAQAYRW